MLGPRLDRDLIAKIVGLIPDVWLRDGEPGRESRVRDAYVRYLLERAQAPRPFLEEALRVGGHRTKKATVTEALQEYIRRRKQAEILGLFVKIDYDPEYDYKKQRSRE